MSFDPEAYGPEVAAILAIDGSGARSMPLVRCAPAHPEARAPLDALAAANAIPRAALAGLYLYHGFWDEAHELAGDDTRDGAYWHAIVHRQEPDASNSRYWFAQVGDHPVFPALREAASAHGVDFGPRWNPSAFIDYCERARGAEAERRALDVQRTEWQLLFDFCARERV